MLQIGPKTTEAAFSFASGASSLSPISRISSGSKVVPIAVEDYWNIYSASTLRSSRIRRMVSCWRNLVERILSPRRTITSKQQGSGRLTGRTLAGVFTGERLPRTPLGPSLKLIAGIPSHSIAQVCHKPTPAIREMASSVVKP